MLHLSLLPSFHTLNPKLAHLNERRRLLVAELRTVLALIRLIDVPDGGFFGGHFSTVYPAIVRNE